MPGKRFSGGRGLRWEREACRFWACFVRRDLFWACFSPATDDENCDARVHLTGGLARCIYIVGDFHLARGIGLY